MFDFNRPSRKPGFRALPALSVLTVLPVAVLVAAWAFGALPSQAADPPKVVWTSPGSAVTVVSDNDSSYLGVRLAEETEHEEGGARVTHVVDDSPADEAGIREGDIIVGFNGRTIRGPGALTKQIRETEPGEKASLDLIRDGSRRSVEIEMGKRRSGPNYSYSYGDSFDAETWEKWGEQWEEWGEKFGEQFGEEWAGKWEDWAEQWEEFGEKWGEEWGEKFSNIFVCEDDDCSSAPGSFYSFNCEDDDCSLFSVGGRPVLGVELVEVTPELREHLGGQDEAGVLISKVLSNTPADKAGIRVGDLILTVDGDPIDSTQDLRRALRDKRGETFSIDIIREKRSMTLEVTIPEPEDDRPTGPRAGLWRSRPPAPAPPAPPVAPVPPVPPVPTAVPTVPAPDAPRFRVDRIVRANANARALREAGAVTRRISRDLASRQRDVVHHMRAAERRVRSDLRRVERETGSRALRENRGIERRIRRATRGSSWL